MRFDTSSHECFCAEFQNLTCICKRSSFKVRQALMFCINTFVRHYTYTDWKYSTTFKNYIDTLVKQCNFFVKYMMIVLSKLTCTVLFTEVCTDVLHKKSEPIFQPEA